MAKPEVQIVLTGENKAQPAFDKANSQLNNLSKQVKVAAGALAAVFSATAFAGWIKGSIDAADNAAKLSASVGLTVEELTALEYAASMSGVSSERLADGINRLNKAMDLAAAGSNKQVELFDRLGVSVVNADGSMRATTAVLDDIADRFKALPAGAEKSALAMELFGKTGATMIPLLNAGSDGIAELTAEAEALGIVISSDAAARAEVFNDNLARMGAASDGFANSMAEELLPTLEAFSDLMVDTNKNTDAAGVIARGLALVMKVLATAVIVVSGEFQRLGSWIGGAAAIAMAVAQGDFKQAAFILNDVIKDTADTYQANFARIEKLWDGSGEASAQAAADERQTLRQREAEFTEHTKNIGEARKKALTEAKTQLRDLVTAEREASRELEKAKGERLKTEERYKLALAKLQGGGTGEASFSQATALKAGARQALQDGDIETAKTKAQEALKTLEALAEAGENTYGFAGIIKELQSIETKADDKGIEEAREKYDAAHAQLTRLTEMAEGLEQIQISATMSEDAASAAIAQMQALADQLSKELVVPIRPVVNSKGTATGLQPDGSYILHDTSKPPGFATGGQVHGPGTGTSDSILARLSNGEFVMRAEAVRRLGPALLDRLNNGVSLPKFADGGLVDLPGAGPSGQSVVLDLGSLGQYQGSMPADQLGALQKQFRIQAIKSGKVRR